MGSDIPESPDWAAGDDDALTTFATALAFRLQIMHRRIVLSFMVAGVAAALLLSMAWLLFFTGALASLWYLGSKRQVLAQVSYRTGLSRTALAASIARYSADPEFATRVESLGRAWPLIVRSTTAADDDQ